MRAALLALALTGCGGLLLEFADEHFSRMYRAEADPLLAQFEREVDRGNNKRACEIKNDLLTLAKYWCGKAQREGVSMEYKFCMRLLSQDPYDCTNKIDAVPMTEDKP